MSIIIFPQRTITEWNLLAGDCVNGTSVNSYVKNKIDNYFIYGALRTAEHSISRFVVLVPSPHRVAVQLNSV